MKLLPFLLFFMPLVAFSQADTLSLSKEQKQKAFTVAKNWVSLLTKGKDVNGILAITTIPFLRDGNETLETHQEVREFYESVIKSKGERTMPPLSASFAKEIPHSFQGSLVVRVYFTYKGKEQNVFVRLAEENGVYRVSGFKD
ncbi:hypothetical protein AM493_11260 [Flavobacterium akiainvivens]|uniref:DUF4783 domain-containing protein n=1 Tax=Flavobacterium akiainvivens TaxID=1202724 RepID=A0A0M8MIZ5_9FLAO|nr:hypothetical protein [Flavobacterium akiainvivens]KOS06548.1 hypothetical protein AM493_11260 [Flavobacterium akiainvivens]SFQ10813.1 hypothetical protein SAMN05444144_101106 [Flavobacterium akiainvivens]